MNAHGSVRGRGIVKEASFEVWTLESVLYSIRNGCVMIILSRAAWFAIMWAVTACAASSPMAEAPTNWAFGQYGIPAVPIHSGIRWGYGVAAAHDGSLYFAAFSGPSIEAIDPKGRARVVRSGLPCGPTRIAVDHSGNVYYTTWSCGQVVKLDTAGRLTILARGYPRASAIAVAPTGDIVFGTETGGLYRLERGKVETLRTDLGVVQGLAIDAQGNLIFGEYGVPNSAYRYSGVERKRRSGKIAKLAPDGTLTILAEGFWRLRDVALGSEGAIYFITEADWEDHGNSGTLGRYVPGKGTEILLYDVDYPEDIDVGNDGSIYFTAERGSVYYAGTILFRFNRNTGARPRRVVVDVDSSIVVAVTQVTIQGVHTEKSGFQYLAPAGKQTEQFWIIPRPLIDWPVDTDADVPMPGSWAPLPAIAVTVGNRPVKTDVYMVRQKRGQRWPSQMKWSPKYQQDVETFPSTFSESPVGFVVAFELPARSKPRTVTVRIPGWHISR